MATGVNTEHPPHDQNPAVMWFKGASRSIFDQEWKTLHDLYPESHVCIKSPKSKECTVSVPLRVDNDTDFVLHFRLTENYPSLVPDICVRSKTLSKSDIRDFVKSLDLVCVNSIGQPMLNLCVEESISFLQNFSGDKAEKNSNHRKRRNKKTINKVCDESLEKNEINFGDNDDVTDSIQSLSNTEDDPSIHTMENCQDFFCELSSPICDTKPPRPNYFVAVRICNENLIKNLITVQNSLVKQEVLLTKGVIPSSAFHVTLCNLGLDRADDLLRAMEALRKMKAELQSVLPATSVVIHGASQFYDRAIYAKVKNNEEFLVFRGILMKKLSESGVEFREDHEQYTPHVTLIKVRRPERRLFGNRPIQPRIYSSFLESVHGEQTVDAVYLCAMDGNKREDGFYVTPYEIQFEGK